MSKMDMNSGVLTLHLCCFLAHSDPNFWQILIDKSSLPQLHLLMNSPRVKTVKVKSLSHIQLFATPWTIAHPAPPSIGVSRQEYWSRLPFLSPGDLHNSGMEPRSPELQADSLPSEPPGKLGECNNILCHFR